MPGRPKRICTYPGCNALSDSSRCDKHTVEAWARAKPTQRIRGRKLQAMRADLFAREPLCAECVKAGRTRLATIRDHVIPLAEGGADDQSNEQGLCDPCHDVKSQQEAQRGAARTRGGGFTS